MIGGTIRQRLIKEVGWFITVVLAVLCELVVVAFAVWLVPELRHTAYNIWIAGAGLMFMMWAVGVYAHLTMKGMN